MNLTQLNIKHGIVLGILMFLLLGNRGRSEQNEPGYLRVVQVAKTFQVREPNKPKPHFKHERPAPAIEWALKHARNAVGLSIPPRHT